MFASLLFACVLTWYGVLPDPLSPQTATANEPPPRPIVIRGELTAIKVISADPENLGTLAVGSLGSRRINFVNSSSSRLTLSVVSTTCGCTQAAFEPAVVGPSEATTLTIAVAVPPVASTQQQSVTFKVQSEADGTEQRGVVVVS